MYAIKLIKCYQKESEHLQEFKDTNSNLEDKVLSYIRANSLTRFLFDTFAAIVIAIYIYLAIAVFKTELTELLLLIFIFVRLLPKTKKIVSSYQQVLNLLPALDLTLTFLKRLKNEKKFNEDNSFTKVTLSQSIQFCEVSFSYDHRAVLDNLSFSILANKTNLILGPSGSGKSTIIDLILALQSPKKGEILIDSVPLNHINSSLWQKEIGFVPQDPFLFHQSIQDNLRWAKPDATDDELYDALSKAGAINLIEKLPNKLKTIVGDRGTQLSGGERQRIALARALIRQPKILILDEATSAVDDKTEELIQQALSKLNGEITIIIVAHRSKLIELADHIIQLS